MMVRRVRDNIDPGHGSERIQLRYSQSQSRLRAWTAVPSTPAPERLTTEIP
jgi:hypothetical protein